MQLGIIGYGRIGEEVGRRALQRNWEIPSVVRSSGIYNSKGEKTDELSNWQQDFGRSNTDIAVLAIPTVDDGETAYQYIKELARMGILVVTSEKGALGNYFSELSPWIDRIGYSATVGGGTRLLYWLRGRLVPETEEIHLIINGTLNYIFDSLSRGRTLDEVVVEAKKLGYAEPKAQSTLEVINIESCKDVPMKIAILLNICGLGEIRAKNIVVKDITAEDLKRLVREANFRRYIVSVTKEKEEEDVIGGFEFPINEWWVSGGFKNRTQNPLFLHLVPPGVNNAVLVHGTDGTYILTGPGAGVVPTVMGSIIKDIVDLMGKST